MYKSYLWMNLVVLKNPEFACWLLLIVCQEAETFAKNAVETNIALVQTEAKGAAGYQGDRAGVRYDDWYCHRCEYTVFAKRSKCPKCGRARSV